MGESRAQMIARAVQKNLRLVFEPTKRAGMNDPRPVALKLRSISVALLRVFTAPRFPGLLRIRRKRRPLGGFHLFPRSPAGSRAHCFDVDPCGSVLNFWRNSRCARRASNLSNNKSKSASSDAVKVSQ